MTFKDGYKFEDLSIGMSHETFHKITEKDLDLFAEVSGDYNPLHMDEDYAKGTVFGQTDCAWRTDGELYLWHFG